MKCPEINPDRVEDEVSDVEVTETPDLIDEEIVE